MITISQLLLLSLFLSSRLCASVSCATATTTMTNSKQNHLVFQLFITLLPFAYLFLYLSLSLTLKTTKSCIAYTSLSSRSFPSIFHRNTRTSPKAISRKNKNNQNQRKECMQTGCKQSTQKSFVRIYSVNLE